MKKIYAKPEVLSALVRAGDAGALRFVVEAVRRSGGDMTRAAKRLGVGVRTLYRWRDEVPGLAPRVTEVALGRCGAARNASRRRPDSAPPRRPPAR